VTGRKTVLIVDDDAGILRVLSDGLSGVLDLFDVVTASNGQEAIQELERRPIDVLVTDLAMPVLDGFSLIGYVTNRRSALPVVVLSGMVGSMLDQRLAGYGGLRVLRKPASYQEVATCVLEEIERVDRGLIEGIPLSGVLQLVEAERRSCRVVVTSGRRRGHLDFESGRLINAFSDDFGAEGEAAAYDILGWSDTAIAFEPLPANVRRLIHTPMQLLLVELAAAQDRDADLGEAPPAEPPAPTGADAAAPGPVDAETPDGGEGSATNAGPGDPAAPPDVVEPEPDDEAAARMPAGDEIEPDAITVDEPEGVDASLLLADPSPTAATEAAREPEAEGAEAAVPVDAATDADREAAAEAPIDAAAPAPAEAREPAPSEARERAPADASDPASTDAPAAGPSAASPPADAHVRDMLAAIERLAQRAKTADEALAAVAAEIGAFREAQRRFDEEIALRERRRRDLERFRDEVGRLAREILGRVDGLFDAMAGDAAERDAGSERPAT